MYADPRPYATFEHDRPLRLCHWAGLLDSDGCDYRPVDLPNPIGRKSCLLIFYEGATSTALTIATSVRGSFTE